MAIFALTTGPDTVVGGPTGNTVYATAATLNAGDSLTGGAGIDVLDLIGSGTFSVDQLAGFTAFESIKVDNPTNSVASLTLGGQPIEVDVTGYLGIQVNSPSNWNSSDIINGDPSSFTTLIFNNFNILPPPSSLPSPVTYDLTSNTLSHVAVINGQSFGGDLTLVINNSDTAGVQSFNALGLNDKLVTASSTLDLSHTTVSGFTVASTNGLGTTFTVGDLGTAFQIAGGPGHDTLASADVIDRDADLVFALVRVGVLAVDRKAAAVLRDDTAGRRGAVAPINRRGEVACHCRYWVTHYTSRSDR